MAPAGKCKDCSAASTAKNNVFCLFIAGGWRQTAISGYLLSNSNMFLKIRLFFAVTTNKVV